MSQARVTDFFSQKKKGVAGAAKSAKPRTTRTRPAPNRDSCSCSSPVHEEFIRVIDEAVGVKDVGSIQATDNIPSSPRTPKRSSADAEFDLGAAVFSATADRCTAKKRRPAGGVREADTAKKSARKKLVLPEEKTQEKAQALSQENILALKHRLQRIKKQAEEIPASSSSCPNNAVPAVRTLAAPSSDIATLRSTVALAKELAAKAQRRKQEKAVDEIQQTETQSQDGSESGTEQPAYLRYHTLAQAVPPGLALPHHYRVLAEMFRSMDTVVAMLYNRSETATFTKIKQGVQDMMHRRFEESHVGQIRTVFPEAYTFRQEKNIPTFSSSMTRSSFQLTVEPVIHSDQKEVRPVLSASLLLERRRIFHQSLLSIVKQHHKVFLSSLVPPMNVPEDKLTRWHPRFNVDTVPTLQVGPLPQIPQTGKLVTAQEVLDQARSLITPKMEKALLSLTPQTGDQCPESTCPPTSAGPAAQLPSSLKGVSQSLLDRIRAKEAQNLQAAMTRNPAQEERLLMMSRLGELARILRNVFVAEKKAALIMEVACSRMVASYRSALSTGEMEKHVRLLAEVAADWLTIHPIRKDLYLKLNKNMELSVVLEKLSNRLLEEEKL
ncbi:DNA replication factor Cdt1 [Melanotaenia boesemani]|uniref:DNA replication factor Cdt1 n=1 Tax=Melanotaenia boesemani TaxID=1250792 RepID=UPI001C05B02A|nr:DNA replication factor Cdt1 [Melanotaenia boesemani]